MLTPLFASRASVGTFSNPNKLDFPRLARLFVRPYSPPTATSTSETEIKTGRTEGAGAGKKQNQGGRETASGGRWVMRSIYQWVGASIQFPGRCFSFRVSKPYNDAVITPTATRDGGG